MINANRWIYLTAGCIALIFLGLIYAWSIFKAPFLEIYPQWSISELSMTFTISMISFCFGGFISGQFIRRIQPMLIIWISASALFAGFFGVSMAQGSGSGEALILLYIFYGIFCGGGVGIGYNCVIGTVNKWFSDKPGLSSGIMMMGFGVGALIFGSLTKYFIGIIGIFSTFRVLAFVVASVLIAVSFFMVSPRRNGTTNTAAANYMRNYSLKQMLCGIKFWLFMLWAIMLNSTGLLIIGNAASISLAFGAPALLGLTVSVFNGGGRVLLGYLYDKFKRKKTLLIDTLLMASAGLLLTVGGIIGWVWLIFLGLLITGIGYGGMPAITSTFVHSEYGSEFFPINFSVATFALIPAALIGPMISSVLIEKSGGNYLGAFMMVVVLAVSAGFIWHLLNFVIERQRLDD